MALVVRQPLPYVYVAREVLRSAGIPCQMFDALPLAAEPYAAALDLVVSCVSANFARGPAIALLRSPHFRFEGATPREDRRARSRAQRRGLSRRCRVARRDDAFLARRSCSGPSAASCCRCGADAPLASHLDTLLAFLAGAREPAVRRTIRFASVSSARARPSSGTLTALRDAYARFDSSPVDFDTVAAARAALDRGADLRAADG